MSSFKAIIVGGGLAGALLANSLLNNNVDFMVYERDPIDSKREGYHIRLGDGAMAGFTACLTSQQVTEIHKKFGKSTVKSATAPSLYTTQFKELIDFTLVPSYSKSAAINRVVIRDLLLESIKKSERIEFGKAFIDYEIITTNDAEKLKVNFEDGSSDICDVLIGADGANSRVNKQLGLNNISRIESHWTFVSKGRLPYDRMMTPSEKLRRGPIIAFSKHTTMYYGLYLPEDSSKATSSDHSSELQYDEEAAWFYWGINIPIRDLPYKDVSEISDKRQVVLAHIKNWAPELA